MRLGYCVLFFTILCSASQATITESISNFFAGCWFRKCESKTHGDDDKTSTSVAPPADDGIIKTIIKTIINIIKSVLRAILRFIFHRITPQPFSDFMPIDTYVDSIIKSSPNENHTGPNGNDDEKYYELLAKQLDELEEQILKNASKANNASEEKQALRKFGKDFRGPEDQPTNQSQEEAY